MTFTSASEAVGDRIRRQRRFMCLTQVKLAEALGVTQASISLWEKGHATVALRHRTGLARELHMDLHTLFAEELSA